MAIILKNQPAPAAVEAPAPVAAPDTPPKADPTPAGAGADLKALLPTVEVTGDLEALTALIKAGQLTPAALTEIVIYLGREATKADVFKDAENAARDALLAYYRTTPEEKRDTVRSRAGLTTYTAATEKDVPKDRDAIVAVLNPEQLRASYIPDLKALQIMLKPDIYGRLMKREPVKDRISVRDLKGDFSEF